MGSVLTKPGIPASRRLVWIEGIRTPERIALAYFFYLALLSLYRRSPGMQRPFLVALLPVLCALWCLESADSRAWSRVLRDWTSMCLILVGYWSMGWFANSSLHSHEGQWVNWDRAILNNFGLRHAIEGPGPAIPYLLEGSYLLLYAIPPMALGAVYLCRARVDTDRLLSVLFLGTLSAYALLPLFPVTSPRLAFPGTDLPAFHTGPRNINTYLLDKFDIATSVFPSGHVAVAFSTAFGLLTALRHRRAIWLAAFAAAILIWIATIYGRYHYAVDGLASIVIAATAWQVVERWATDAR